VAASDVEDGYALLHGRRRSFGHLLRQYSVGLGAFPAPQNFSVEDESAVGREEVENLDLFESEE
jgi:hypothetical protein